MTGLCILGSTGSIGTSTLDVVRLHPERYKIIALTANRNVDSLLQQCTEFKPQYAAMADEKSAQLLRERLASTSLNIDVLSGAKGLEELAALPEVDAVMAAIVGAAGLLPALAAVREGKRILLANKEALVISGQLFMDAVKKYGAEILPIDSEHNAVFQCMPENFEKGFEQVGIRRILLTASGGPFRTSPIADLKAVTPEQACAHPNWVMGRKISVDSATMMNKGLEVIEARWLFNAHPDQISVVVHPQSVIHSMVEYTDGSVLAQMGNPDMRTPIAHALAWPERIESGVKSLDLFSVAHLDFEAPDFDRFPCLRLAFDAVHAGQSAPAVLNAANEIAVDAFLNGRLGFTEIAHVAEEALSKLPLENADSLEAILHIDKQARQLAEQYLISKV